MKKIFLFLFLFLSLVVPAMYAGTCAVDANTTYQYIRAIGASSAWYGLAGASATALFADDNVNGHIGLSSLRARIDPNGNHSAEVGNLVSAKSANSNLLCWAAEWSPPIQYKANNNVNGGADNNTFLGAESGTPNSADTGYANYLVSYIQYAKSRGIDLYAVSPQNEPNWNPDYESCLWTAGQFEVFVRAFKSALNAAGLTTKIMFPEVVNTYGMNLASTTMNNATTASYVGIIATHLYGTPNPGTLASYGFSKVTNQEWWETEISGNTTDAPGAMEEAGWIHNSLVNAGMNAFHYWWIQDLATNGKLNIKAFTLGNYSKFIRPGYYRMAATAAPSTNVMVSAFKNTNTSSPSKFVIVAVNKNTSSVSQTFSLSSLNASSVTPWLTNSNTGLVAQAAVTVSNGSFTYNLPAQSVVSFVGTNSTGPTATSTPCVATAITPYLQVGTAAWQQTSNVTVASLPATVNLGPQPTTGGSWSWTGPNGFTSTSRELLGIALSVGTNVYTATYTNDCGAKSTQAFTITVQSGATSTPTTQTTPISTPITSILGGNPLMYQKYTADPTARWFNNRMYIYCSHDKTGATGYDITDVTLMSSDDLVNWTDEGESVKASDTSWAGLTYAPDAVYRNGYYYVYFGNGGGSIGVVRSTSPTGPWTDPVGRAIVTGSTPGCSGMTYIFDPDVFIDDDGQAYMYFGGGGPGNARVIKLNSDMISVNGSAVTIDAPRYFEAPFMNKRNGIYYFSYCTDFSASPSASIDYMTSSNPMTGFTRRGTILDNPSDNCGNNSHASIVNIGSDWYLAYHTRRLSNTNLGNCNGIYQRSASLDRLYFNADGTIQKVKATTTGVNALKTFNPYATNKAVTMAKESGISTETCSEGGLNVANIENNDWIQVKGVNFGTGATGFNARVASATGGGNIVIRLDSTTGPIIGTCAVAGTGGWQAWQTKSCAISGATGTHDVFFVFTGGTGFLFNFASYSFTQSGITATNTPTRTNTPASPTATPTTPVSTSTPIIPTATPTIPIVTGGLRDLAAAKGMLIGSEATGNPLQNEAIYRTTLAKEFNWMGGENEFKAYLWSGPYTYNFTTTDYYRNFRDTNNMNMRGHVLVYNAVVPSWMSGGSYTNTQISDMLKAYVQAMAGRYSGKMNEWDVVNEAVSDGAPYGYKSNDFWYQKLGDYIPQAFRWAREADPNAKLIYNDYGNEGLNEKSNYIYNMVSNMKAQNVPIDGVGWQCHIDSNWRLNDDIWENAQRLSALGLRITVTELDVAIPVPVDAAKLQSQAKAYADMTYFCMTHPGVKRMFMWGFTDKYSWIPGFSDGASDAALIFDSNYAKKPAYYAIQTVLGMQPNNGIYNGGFENSVYCWNEMSGGNISEETSIVHSGSKSIKVSNRSQAYQGVGQHMLWYLLQNGQGAYDASVWARLASGTDNARLTIFIKDDAGSRYINVGSTAANSTAWSQVTGSVDITWTGLLRAARIYVETENGTSTFYADDMQFKKAGSVNPTNTPTSTLTATATMTATATLKATPVISSTWRVLAGSTTAYTDSQGKIWAADSNYSGGAAYNTTQTVSNALPSQTDQALYQTERYGSPFTYVFDVPAGSYQVTLKMAETYFAEAGQRVFDLSLNGIVVLSGFDLYTAAGGAFKGYDRVFDNVTPVNGTISIQFGPATVDNAKVCAIQIVPQPATPTYTATFTLTRTSTPANTGTPTFTATATMTSTATATMTPMEPEATETPVTPSATPTTAVPTDTPVTPSATPTTAVPTNTPVTPTATPTTSVSANISLYLKSGDTNNSTGSPHPQIRVMNTGTAAINLDNVEARYWFNCDCTSGQSVQAWIDWAGKMPAGSTISGNVQVSAVTTAIATQTHYVRIKFTGGITLQPGEYAEIQLRYNKSDWSAMLQANDWSYAAYTSFTSWNRITGYVNGTLMWGQEPEAATQSVSAVVSGVLGYPNPASSDTGATLSYTIAGSGVTSGSVSYTIPDPDAKVDLKIFTMGGRLLWTKQLTGASNVSTGSHAVKWDGKTAGGKGLSAGTYMLKVSVLSGGSISSKSFVIIMYN